MRFEIHSTPLSGACYIQRKPLIDERGSFERMFCNDELQPFLQTRTICQINLSETLQAGTIRGLHFQFPPHAETKFVSCILGEIFDVAVDLRRGSPTFLQWYGLILSESNHKTFVIPEGFGHGYQSLTDKCQMVYCHTAPYSPQHEGGLYPLDPRLAIDWPQQVTNMSRKDKDFPLISNNYNGIII